MARAKGRNQDDSVVLDNVIYLKMKLIVGIRLSPGTAVSVVMGSTPN